MGKALKIVALSCGGILLAVFAGLSLLIWADPIGGRKDWNEQEAKKKVLLSTRATKEEAIKILGPCTDYSRGGTNEAVLKEVLARDPKNWPEVREKSRQWPGVIFTTTANVQTWIFLNESNRVVDVVLLAQ